MYNDNIDLQYYKKSTDNLNLQIVDYQKRVDNFQVQNDKLSERLSKSETGFFERVGFFMLGAAAATLIAYGASRAVR